MYGRSPMLFCFRHPYLKDCSRCQTGDRPQGKTYESKAQSNSRFSSAKHISSDDFAPDGEKAGFGADNYDKFSGATSIGSDQYYGSGGGGGGGGDGASGTASSL